MLILIGSLILLFLLVFAGIRIFVAIGIVGFILLFMRMGGAAIPYITDIAWELATNFVLVAIPLFILMGELLARTGTSHVLYTNVSKMIRGLPGGLLQSNIAACTIFAAISGSSVASAATIGRTAYAEQVKKLGYHPSLVVGSVAAGGTLGLLIPPSVQFILYGVLAEESVGRLYAAGVFPGLMISSVFMVYIAVRTLIQPALVPHTLVPAGESGIKNRLSGLLNIWPFFLIIVIVLGSIYGGITTATEAAAIGVICTIAYTVARKALTWQILKDSTKAAVLTSCMAYFLVISAKVMSTSMAFYGLNNIILSLSSTFSSDISLMGFIVLLYLVLGCFFDGLSMMVLTFPIILPVLWAAGFDKVWFGVIMCLLVECSTLTPPVGLNLFVIQGITGEKLETVAKGSLPFVIILLSGIIILFFWPQIALWLPNALYNQ